MGHHAHSGKKEKKKDYANGRMYKKKSGEMTLIILIIY